MVRKNNSLPFSRDRRTGRKRSSGRKFLLLLLLFAAVGGFFLFFTETEDEKPPPVAEIAAPPIIASEEFKSPPDEPGGLEIAHQDKLIYERLTPEGAAVSSEDTLNEVMMGLVAEEPLADFSTANSGEDSARPATPSVSAEDSSQSVTLPDFVKDFFESSPLPDLIEDTFEPATASTEPEASESGADDPEASEPKTSEPEESTPEEGAEPEPEPSATPSPDSPELKSSGDYVVQLGAFTSDTAANAALKRTALQFSDAAGVDMLFVQRADLGDRGVWYRLRVGYFATRDEAEEVCAGFQSLGQDCLATTR